MHGLFGNALNWRAISKSLVQSDRRIVAAMDLRNHGRSPWSSNSSPFNYSEMAQDVYETFLNDSNEGDGKVDLIGHSMGGKVVMTMALKYPHMVNRMVVVDMMPFKGRLDATITTALSGMAHINSLMFQPENRRFLDRQQADQILLERGLTDKLIRQFVMTNYVPFNELHATAKHFYTEKLDGFQPPFAFRVNVDAIRNSIDSISDSVLSNISSGKDQSAVFDGEVLFIYGKKSGYVDPAGMGDSIRQLFPRAEFLGLNTGHWVHSEDPLGFVRVVQQFLDRH